jgi:probable poly-beta-1,6-N-acetyl-D-glucosamine export protein
VKFRHSIENLRAVAIVLVMLSHLGSLHVTGEWGAALYFLVGGGTTWFVFLAGYLFAYLEFQSFDYPDYLRKKWRNVITPYLVLSALPVIGGLVAGRHTSLDLSAPAYVAWSLLVGGSVVPTFWFIPMIGLVYLITPMFYRLRDSAWLYVFTAVGLAATLFTARPVGNLNPFLSLVHFVGVFALGILVCKHAKVVEAMRRPQALFWMAVGLAMFAWAAMVYPGFRADWTFSQDLGDFNAIEFGKLGLLLTTFIGFEKFFNHRQAVLSYVAGISFGLYFIHGFFLGVFDTLTKFVALPEVPAVIALDAVLMMGISFLTVATLKKLTGRWSRHVIGC